MSVVLSRVCECSGCAEFGVSHSAAVRIDRGGVAFTLELSPVKPNADGSHLHTCLSCSGSWRGTRPHTV